MKPGRQIAFPREDIQQGPRKLHQPVHVCEVRDKTERDAHGATAPHPQIGEKLIDRSAKDLVLTGRTVTGEEALALGLATRLSDDPHRDGLALAREIAAMNPPAGILTSRSASTSSPRTMAGKPSPRSKFA